MFSIGRIAVVLVVLASCCQAQINNGGSGGGSPTGPCGGDLAGNFPNCTVNTTTYPNRPSIHSVGATAVRAGSGGATSITMSAPASITNGDALWMFVSVGGQTAETWTPPTGFTQVGSTLSSGGNHKIVTGNFCKIASSESGSYVINFTNNVAAGEIGLGTVIAFSGTTCTPDTSGTSSGNASSLTVSGITPTKVNDLWVMSAVLTHNAGGNPALPQPINQQTAVQQSLSNGQYIGTITADAETSPTFAYNFHATTNRSLLTDDSTLTIIALSGTVTAQQLPVTNDSNDTGFGSVDGWISNGLLVKNSIEVYGNGPFPSGVIIPNCSGCNGTNTKPAYYIMDQSGRPQAAMAMNSAGNICLDCDNLSGILQVGNGNFGGATLLIGSGQISQITRDALEDIPLSAISAANDLELGNAQTANTGVRESRDNIIATYAAATSNNLQTRIRNGGNDIVAIDANGVSALTGCFCIDVPNASSTGTTLNTLTKLTSAPSTAVIAATTDISGIVGISVANPGTSGSCTITNITMTSGSPGLLTVACTNSFSVGESVVITGTNVGNNQLNGANFTIASASGSQFTANYDNAFVLASTASTGTATVRSARIAIGGEAPCVYDGATTAGDYVQPSTTTGGDCHDTGVSAYQSLAAQVGSAEVIGIVLSTNGGGGTYNTQLWLQPAAQVITSSNNSTTAGIAAAGNAGSSNTTFGHATGTALNSSSSNNTLMGDIAGSAITSGTDNTLIGQNAGKLIVSTLGSTCVGSQSCANTTASDMTCIGHNACVNNSASGTSVADTAVGKDSQNGVTTGTLITTIGQDAMVGLSGPGCSTGTITSITGTRDTALGQGAFCNATGAATDDTFVGQGSGIGATTPNQTTCVGSKSCQGITTQNNNTIVGYLGNVSSNSITNCTGLGASVSCSASNTTVLGGPSNTGFIFTGLASGVLFSSSGTISSHAQSGSSNTLLSINSGQAQNADLTFDASGNAIQYSSVPLKIDTAPTIASGGCGGSGASILNNNGTAVFTIGVGSTPGSACTVTMPAATTTWVCMANDQTTQSTAVSAQRQTGAISTTSVTITNFSDVTVATAFVASDRLNVTCSAE